MEVETPRKSHHRWVHSASQRSSGSSRNCSSSSGLHGLGQAYDSLRDTSRSCSSPRALQRSKRPSEDGWDEASHAARTFLMTKSASCHNSEEIGLLRSRMLRSDKAPLQSEGAEAEIKLARAEYVELRAMHLLFVEASNKKVADLQEAYSLRQLEIDELRRELEDERKGCSRLQNELDCTRRALTESTLEVKIAQEKLQPFLAARESLMDEVKGKASERVHAMHENNMHENKANVGILKTLCKNVPVLERELQRYEKRCVNEQKDIKDKHVVLMTNIINHREKAIKMCTTLRQFADQTRAMHAFRNVVSFERQKRNLLRSMQRKVGTRLTRRAFNHFVQNSVMHNLLRRRGYLCSVRNIRLLKLRFFSAWRWAHFAGRWLPSSQAVPVKSARARKSDVERPREESGSRGLDKSSLLTRTAIMAMTEYIGKHEQQIEETDGALQSLTLTMSQLRQQEQHIFIGQQGSSAHTFDPNNLAMARARENFEKAGAGGPRRDIVSKQTLHVSEATKASSRPLLFSHTSDWKLKQTPQKEDRPAKSNKLNISTDSDSSFDDVLEEAERESMRWVGRHKLEPKITEEQQPSTDAHQSVGWAESTGRALNWVRSPDNKKWPPGAREHPQKSLLVVAPAIVPRRSDRPDHQHAGGVKFPSNSPLRLAATASDASELRPTSPLVSLQQPPVLSFPSRTPSPEKRKAVFGRLADLSPRSRFPQTPATSPNLVAIESEREIEMALQEKLRIFYAEFVPMEANHPDPALVAKMYYKDESGLNIALRKKYGANLADISRRPCRRESRPMLHSNEPDRRSRTNSPQPSLSPVRLGVQPPGDMIAGTGKTSPVIAQGAVSWREVIDRARDEVEVKARRKKIMNLLQDDSIADSPFKPAAARQTDQPSEPHPVNAQRHGQPARGSSPRQSSSMQSSGSHEQEYFEEVGPWAGAAARRKFETNDPVLRPVRGVKQNRSLGSVLAAAGVSSETQLRGDVGLRGDVSSPGSSSDDFDLDAETYTPYKRPKPKPEDGGERVRKSEAFATPPSPGSSDSDFDRLE